MVVLSLHIYPAQRFNFHIGTTPVGRLGGAGPRGLLRAAHGRVRTVARAEAPRRRLARGALASAHGHRRRFGRVRRRRDVAEREARGA